MEDRLAKRIMFFGMVLFMLWGVIDFSNAKHDLGLDRLFIAGIIALTLKFRKRMNLTRPVLLFGAVPVAIHSGKFYGNFYLGIPFDHYMHLIAGAAIGMVFFKYLAGDGLKDGGYSKAIVLSVLITAGIGSLMEIIEFLGYSYFGEGEGIFFYGAGDAGEWENAVRDMVNNIIGAGIGAVIGYFWERKKASVTILTRINN